MSPASVASSARWLSPPHLNLKANCEEEAVSCWDLMCTCETERLKDRKVYGVWFSLNNRPALDLNICFHFQLSKTE